MADWYCSSVAYMAVAPWQATHTYAVGNIVRQVGTNSTQTVTSLTSVTTVATATVTAHGYATGQTVTIAGAVQTNYNKTTTITVTGANTFTYTITATTSPATGTITSVDAPAAGNERCFRCSAITTGISGATEPAWTITKAGTTSETTVTWIECSGNSAQQQVGGITNTWTAPHARLLNAMANTWAVAGDRVFISSDNADTVSVSLSIGVGTANTTIISVNRTTGNIPPLAADMTAGASVATTGTNLTLNINGLVWGVTFKAGVVGTTAAIATSASVFVLFINCALQLLGTSPNGLVSAGNSSFAVFRNTTMQFATTGSGLSAGQLSTLIWEDTVSALVGATIPNPLITALVGGHIILRGLDLSMVSNNPIFQWNNSGFQLMYNCKLGVNCGGSRNILSTVVGPGTIESYNCDSTNSTSTMEYYNTLGSVVADPTTFRTNGATNGVTPISHCMRSGTLATVGVPFVGVPIYAWNTLTGSSHTATICIASGLTLNNNDIWLDLEYLGTSSAPQSLFVSNDPATYLTVAAAQTTDASSSWTFANSLNFGNLSANAVLYTYAPWQVAIKTASSTSGIITNVGSSSGKVYVEFTVTTLTSTFRIGFCNLAYTVAGVLGGTTTSVAYNPNTGVVTINASTLSTIQTATTGDVIGVAFDIGASKIWIRTNTGNWNNAAIGSQNPATGTGGISTSTLAAGPYYAAFSDLSAISATVVNCGPGYANTAPSGFGSPSLVLQKLTVSFTAQLPGLLCARVKLAKPSTAVYVDPLLTVV